MTKRTTTIILAVAAIAVFATLAISSSMKSDPKSGSHMMQNGQSMSGSSMSQQDGGGEMKMSK